MWHQQSLDLIVFIAFSYLAQMVLISPSYAYSGVADSYPIMIEDGEDSFLILNDDEVASSQLLKHLSGASKEEVEEIVDSNPQVQDMILDKIKVAVEKRKKTKGPIKDAPIKLFAPTTKVVENGSKYNDQQIIQVVHDYKGKNKLIEVGKDVDNDDDEEEEEDDEQDLDEKKIAKLRANLKAKAAKMFKIGAKFKQKLMKFARNKNKKNKSKNKSGRQNQNNRHTWPHFHYKVSTS